jgi:hypothetical protein
MGSKHTCMLLATGSSSYCSSRSVLQGEVGREGVLFGSCDGFRLGDRRVRVAAHGIVGEGDGRDVAKCVACQHGPGCSFVGSYPAAGVISVCGRGCSICHCSQASIQTKISVLNGTPYARFRHGVVLCNSFLSSPWVMVNHLNSPVAGIMDRDPAE